MMVSVVCVVCTAEDAVEDMAEDFDEAAEEDIEDTTEDAAEDAANDDDVEPTAAVEEAADTEIKLPPLLNNVTVDCPLTTTVDAVTVLCAPPATTVLLPSALPLLPLATVVCALVVVVGSAVNENEYVVFGIKLSGNVAKADESTDNAFVVSGTASVDGRVVMVVKCVVAVVWMGMITARVKEGGIDTVAV